MSETPLMRSIQIECCADPWVRLWRNNVGEGWVGEVISSARDRSGLRVTLHHARHIKFGLGTGTSDLVGLKSIIITPDMVGKRLAVPVLLEVKDRKTRTTDQQRTFLHVTQNLGAIAAIVRSADEALEVLTDPLARRIFLSPR